jgi:exosortase D (VPLPA-CTERM-specific)
MKTPVFHLARAQIVGALLAAIAIALIFSHTFEYLYANWQREEYSHGILIPLVSGFLLWQQRPLLERLQFNESWAGAVVLLFGLAVYFMGSLASITAVDAYALVFVVAGCALAISGWQAFRLMLVPLALLLLMNPLPAFLYNNLSSRLQLISSQVGVAVIRLFNISVLLDGNVIDLGSYKLQVVEACSGLRYLFPLLTLGVIVACFLKSRAWIRWLIVLSTVPITILMNSFRIGVIGVLVERYGISQAEGFLHDFEGWIVFMACLALLLAETWLLLRVSGDRRAFRDIVAFDIPGRRPPELLRQPRRIGVPSAISLALLLSAVYPAIAIPQRAEIRPTRAEYVEFPMKIADWQGRRDRLDADVLGVLKLDDYVLADFSKPDSPGINFYSAYYASQRTGESAHSPASCLPGGGWRMSQFLQQEVPGARLLGQPLVVNRVVITRGTDRQLVYYWFQQRGRDLTNEYLVKWYLFRDSLVRNRSDGALVRLVTPLGSGENSADGDARLIGFAQQLVPQLGRFVPD